MSKTILISNRLTVENIDLEEVDFLLNVSNVRLGHEKEVFLAEKYQQKLLIVKQKYFEFIDSTYLKSKLGVVDFFGTPMAIFWRFVQRDTWTDSFITDIVCSLLVKEFVRENQLSDVKFKYHYDGNLYLEPAGGSGLGRLPTLIIAILRVFKFFMKTIFLALGKVKGDVPQGVSTLFFSFFPQNVILRKDEIYDRQFGDIISRNNDFAFCLSSLESIDEQCLKVKEEHKGIHLESLLTLGIILKTFRVGVWIKFFLKFFSGYRQRFEFEGLEVSDKIQGDLATSLFSLFYFRLRYFLLQKLIKQYSPKQMVCSGEFGPDALCMSIALNNTETNCLWYQHTPFAEDKLWLTLKGRLLGKVPLPNRILVWGKSFEEFIFRTSGIEKEKVKIVENFKYYNYHPSDSMQMIKRPYKLIFLPAVIKEEVLSFLNFSNQLVEEGILTPEEAYFKIHPDSSRYYDFPKLLSNFKNLAAISYSDQIIKIEELITYGELFVVGSSQMGLELMLNHRKFYQYIPLVGMNYSPFGSDPAVLNFSEFNQLKKYLVEGAASLPQQGQYFEHLNSKDLEHFRSVIS